MAESDRQRKKQKTNEEKKDSGKSGSSAADESTGPEHLTRDEKIIIADIERQPDMNYPEEYRSKSDDEDLTPEPIPLEDCELPRRKKEHKKKKDKT